MASTQPVATSTVNVNCKFNASHDNALATQSVDYTNKYFTVFPAHNIGFKGSEIELGYLLFRRINNNGTSKGYGDYKKNFVDLHSQNDQRTFVNGYLNPYPLAKTRENSELRGKLLKEAIIKQMRSEISVIGVASANDKNNIVARTGGGIHSVFNNGPDNIYLNDIVVWDIQDFQVDEGSQIIRSLPGARLIYKPASSFVPYSGKKMYGLLAGVLGPNIDPTSFEAAINQSLTLEDKLLNYVSVINDLNEKCELDRGYDGTVGFIKQLHHKKELLMSKFDNKDAPTSAEASKLLPLTTYTDEHIKSVSVYFKPNATPAEQESGKMYEETMNLQYEMFNDILKRRVGRCKRAMAAGTYGGIVM
jgi:hypothetical protein